MATEWEKVKNSMYWQGPGSWTICEVRVMGEVRFELWSGSPREKGCGLVDWKLSLEEAIELYDTQQAVTPAA
ncbi:hypothetical protein CEK28_08745 [Xenophilus sp. AP218F]|nr:hypothetical protein CEK28_08745 [Xenophilus sp. AP218F]